MKDFYFVYFPIGYDFIKTMECTFKYLPKDTNVIVVTTHPELINKSYDFNLTILRLDDLRTDWSKKNETLIYEIEPEAYRKKFFEFQKSGIRFPYAIHRFIIPYLIERNITKFAILDSDCLINYGHEKELENFMLSMENYCKDRQYFFGPIMDQTTHKEELRKVGQDVLRYLQINEEVIRHLEEEMPDTYHIFDGYLRGFWLNNVRDLKLFYDLWNLILINCYATNSHLIKASYHIVSDEWLHGYVCYIMEKLSNIKTEDLVFNGRRIIKHIYHPENYYFYLHHGLYTSPIEKGGYGLVENPDRTEFMRNNTEGLKRFFMRQNGIEEHRIPEVIYDYPN